MLARGVPRRNSHSRGQPENKLTWGLGQNRPERPPGGQMPPIGRPIGAPWPPPPPPACSSFVPGAEAAEPPPEAPGNHLSRLQGRRPEGPESAPPAGEIEAPTRSAPAAACGRQAPNAAARGLPWEPPSGCHRWLRAAPAEIDARTAGVTLTAPAPRAKGVDGSEAEDQRDMGGWAWA